jgi:hypothetical protein
MSAGSTVACQTVSKACSALRRCTVTLTGAAGTGKRSDSWKVRCECAASAVVTHSAKIEAKPRE